MRQFLVIIMLINVCFLSVQEAGYYLFFKLNQDYIAQTLCVNQDDVELLCSGKCYLKKVIETNQEEQNTPQSRIPQFDQEDIRYLNTISLASSSTEVIYFPKFYHYSSPGASPWHASLFRPPIG